VKARLLLVVAVLALATAGTAAAAKPPLPGFRTAGGNIRCLLLSVPTGNLLCTIDHATYAAKLQNRCLNPKGQTGAGVDWHGFLLTPTRKGQINCSGGILYDPSRAKYLGIGYGKTWALAGYSCTSHVSGLTCRNAKGHGLFISRRAWRTW
jgi:hypothetical protein